METSASSPSAEPQSTTLFGHPTGLFLLFFAEMWERFSYYGMRALLLLYMMKDFLQYSDGDAYAVYGAYAALVYMTPFFGGLLADRLLGTRRAVLLGGTLMALGHLLMTLRDDFAFFTALALLVVGNGFFKPNISTTVGTLYRRGSPKRDAGFTIFYMGINLGAALAPLLCGYIGETVGWHWGFGLATIGMLVGLAVFAAPSAVSRWMILAAAVGSAVSLAIFRSSEPVTIIISIFVGLMLLAAAIVAFVAAGREGLPASAGAPPDRARLRRKVLGPLTAEWAVYLGAVICIPVFTLLVSGFAVFTADARPISLVSADYVKSLAESDSAATRAAAVVVKEVSKPAGIVLFVAGLAAFGYIIFETVKLRGVARQRMIVVLVLMVFSMLFWTFFEQAGTSVNNFTDRNVDRVFATQTITPADVGKTIQLQPTQEQLGYRNGEELFTLDVLTRLRKEHPDQPSFEIAWHVTAGNVGMQVAKRSQAIPASVFQSANPIYILLLGLPFTALWSFLSARGWEPSTPVKFSIGLLMLGLGFVALWHGAQTCDDRGMVALSWLLLGYLLHTMGELCISPVGLSMVTRLAPARLVNTAMGVWFLALSFAQFAAAIIAQFTRVGQEAGEESTIPPPVDTVHVYGDVFGQIAIAAGVAAAVCLLLSPILKRMMHEGVEEE